MKANWQIRTGSPEDIAAVLSLWSDIGEIKSVIADTNEDLARFMGMNPQGLLVACCGDEIIGTVMGAYNGWRAGIYHLAVRSDYRRQGIGESLLKTSLDHLQKQGAPRVDLYTYSTNSGAQSFYEQMGWQERSNVKNYSWFF